MVNKKTFKAFPLVGERNSAGVINKTDAMRYFSKVYYGWTNNDNDPNGIVTIPNEETVTLNNPFIVGQYFEDGFPYLAYLVQGDCFTGEKYLTEAEENDLLGQYWEEQAVIVWLKQKGYDSVVCWHYDSEPGTALHYIFVL